LSEKEAFICPFCGAPYRTLIPAGAVQVECQYCKSTILVPPRLGGVVQRCPNHPDVLAVGLCNDCGNSYCDRCLYVYRVRDGKLHVCSECYQKRQNKKIFGAVSAATIMLCLTLAAIPKPPVAGAFFLLFIMFAFIAFYEYDIAGKPVTIHDSK
jgi:DNA-directed RNA polymerase subunit RPC12/RpoP